jgi:hypothetical protein
MNNILIGIVGTIISFGIAALIKGQYTIKNDAKEGRRTLHTKFDNLDTKVDKYSDRLIKLETFHKVNHPGQQL